MLVHLKICLFQGNWRIGKNVHKNLLHCIYYTCIQTLAKLAKLLTTQKIITFVKFKVFFLQIYELQLRLECSSIFCEKQVHMREIPDSLGFTWTILSAEQFLNELASPQVNLVSEWSHCQRLCFCSLFPLTGVVLTFFMVFCQIKDEKLVLQIIGYV